MISELRARAGQRLRQALEVESMQVRLDAIEERMGRLERSVEEARWPHGPVYLGDHQALVATRWGAKMVVDTRDYLLAPWLLMDGLWESHVTGWLNETLQPGDRFVDVGANIGYFTLLAAKLVGPTGLVTAVEAHPEIFGLLQRNVVMNGHRDTVTLLHRAAWSETVRLPFHRRRHYAANSSLASAGERGLGDLADSEDTVSVDAVRLDDVLDSTDRVDVIKVDVEGAEVHAFGGLEQTIRANPGLQVMLEWAPEQIALMGDEPRSLLDLLSGHGFGFRLLEDGLAPIGTESLAQLRYGNVVAQR